MRPRLLTLIAALAAGVGVSACTDGYGYSGVSLGYGGGYYDGGYYDDYYGYGSPYYSSFGSPYWGWYGDYYYPGTGYYVYDRYRRPYRWNNTQRRYWESRRGAWRGDRNWRDNWGGFGGDRNWNRDGRDWNRGDRDGRDWNRGDRNWNRDRGQDNSQWRGDRRPTPGAGGYNLSNPQSREAFSRSRSERNERAGRPDRRAPRVD